MPVAPVAAKGMFTVCKRAADDYRSNAVTIHNTPPHSKSPGPDECCSAATAVSYCSTVPTAYSTETNDSECVTRLDSEHSSVLRPVTLKARGLVAAAGENGLISDLADVSDSNLIDGNIWMDLRRSVRFEMNRVLSNVIAHAKEVSCVNLNRRLLGNDRPRQKSVILFCGIYVTCRRNSRAW